MKRYFNETFFKFALGFLLLILLGVAGILITGAFYVDQLNEDGTPLSAADTAR